MKEEREAEEDGPWAWTSEDDTQRTPSSSSKHSSSSARSGQSRSGEDTSWRWQGQPVGPKSIDESKKQQALEACADLHGALVGCLKKQGFFVDCSEPQKAFWDCYATHRGLRGNKIAACDRSVAKILENLPMTLEEDRARKRQARGEWPFVDTLINGLSDDVVKQIFVKLPRSSWFSLRHVSRAWRNAVQDPAFYLSRVNLNLTETWCYTETWHPKTNLVSWFAFDFSKGAWRTLPPTPRKRGLDPEVFGRASSSLRGELYVVGGKAGNSGPTLREMYIYSPFTHRWRKGKSMITTRHSPLMFSIFECKIYVMGGFDFLNNAIASGECYDADTDEWTIVGNVDYPGVLCPSCYKVGWEVQWTQFHFMDDEHYVSYKTKDSDQVVKCYIPRKGIWMSVEYRDKAKALMRYSFGTVVNKNVVMLDWANGRFRYTLYPSREVAWATVPGMADLDWVSILRSNPKVSALGSKLVFVGRRLSIWMIETDPTLLKAGGGHFIHLFPAKPNAPDLEPLGCVAVVA